MLHSTVDIIVNPRTIKVNILLQFNFLVVPLDGYGGTRKERQAEHNLESFILVRLHIRAIF